MQDFSIWKCSRKNRHYPCLDINQYLNEKNIHPKLNFLYMTLAKLSDEILNKIKYDSTIVLLLDTYNEHGMSEHRRMFMKFHMNKPS